MILAHYHMIGSSQPQLNSRRECERVRLDALDPKKRHDDKRTRS
jgi:hypothetical protein